MPNQFAEDYSQQMWLCQPEIISMMKSRSPIAYGDSSLRLPRLCPAQPFSPYAHAEGTLDILISGTRVASSARALMKIRKNPISALNYGVAVSRATLQWCKETERQTRSLIVAGKQD